MTSGRPPTCVATTPSSPTSSMRKYSANVHYQTPRRASWNGSGSGSAERIEDHPTPRRVHDEPFVITGRAFVEQDGHTSNITTLGPRPATGATDVEPEPAPAPPAPRPKVPPAPSLTPEDLDGCGIYEINGIPTTTYGDHRAEQILSGEIPLEQAKREEQARRRTNMGRPGISSPYL
jgi:hypothetical protein